jgi:PAS domain S-box-containing protein
MRTRREAKGRRSLGRRGDRPREIPIPAPSETAQRGKIGHGLRETRQRLRKFFDQCLIGVAITSPDKGWVDFNDRISDILGYTRDELRALTWAEITHPDDLDLDCAHFARLLAGEIESYSLEKRFVRRDGSPVWTAISINAVRSGNGTMDYVVGLMEDINQRKAAEAELRQARDTLQSLIEASPVAIMGLDSQGCVLSWNPAAERLFGWSAAEVLGRPLPIVPESDRQWFLERRAAVARGEKCPPARVRGLQRNGSLVAVNFWMAPLYDKSGAIAGTMAMLVDETERQALIAQLQDREARLRQLSRSLIEAQECERRRIAQELHDQIGQSLTMVKIRLQTLQRGLGAAADPEALRTAVESVDRATGQVQAMSFALRPPILDDLGIAAALRSHADRQARAAGIEPHLSISTPDRLSRVVETACFRVAEEAIVNVIRHAGARNLWIALRRSGQAFEMTIRDDGRGFDVAATLEGAQRARLGLSSMIERAESAGGGVEIHSTPGAGAEVRVTFPCTADAAGEALAAREPS